MLPQNMLTHVLCVKKNVFFLEKIQFCTALDLIKYLKQIKGQKLLLTSEDPPRNFFEIIAQKDAF